jgi:hypothetical protein
MLNHVPLWASLPQLVEITEPRKHNRFWHLDLMHSCRLGSIEKFAQAMPQYGMASTLVGDTPIIVVSFPGVRGKQRWVAAVPHADMQ